jgi:hypothetical protein
MASCHVAALFFFAALIAFAGTPAHADSPPQPPRSGPAVIIPNLVIPTELPDLVFGGTSYAASCTANRTLRIEIRPVIKNVSTIATADLSKITWQIVVEAKWFVVNPSQLENPNAKTVMPQQGGPTALAPGAQWKPTLTITGVPAYRKDVAGQGLYNLTVDIDPLQGVKESNEGNNHGTGYVLDPCPKS